MVHIYTYVSATRRRRPYVVCAQRNRSTYDPPTWCSLFLFVIKSVVISRYVENFCWLIYNWITVCKFDTDSFLVVKAIVIFILNIFLDRTTSFIVTRRSDTQCFFLLYSNACFIVLCRNLPWLTYMIASNLCKRKTEQ